MAMTQTIAPPKTKIAAIFEYVFGDVRSTAIYRRSRLEGVTFQVIHEHNTVSAKVSRQQISDVFTAGVVDPDRFLRYLNDPPYIKPHQSPGSGTTPAQLPHPDAEVGQLAYEDHLAVVETLRAIATTANIYSYMPNASVELSIIRYGALTQAHRLGNKRELTVHKYRKTNDLLQYTLSRSATLACVSMFESGGFDLQPDDLSRVMAMSTGDSIFVAAPWLCDPAIHLDPHELRRIVGKHWTSRHRLYGSP